MNNRQLLACAFVTLFASTCLSPGLCLPSTGRPEFRKFAEKPNNLKKVSIDNNALDDVTSNQIQDSGFSWSNMLGMIMQMIFNPAQAVGPSKSDSLDADGGSGSSPWANIISVGLKIVTMLLGGAVMPTNDGIDKVDNGSSPMQFINIVVNLLDALKTSFSHRSMEARSLGKKDSVSEAATASLTMLKAYVRSFKTSDDKCLQKYVCEANKECSSDLSGTSTLYCRLGSYATSFLMERVSTGSFDSFYTAGRRGRSGEDCQAVYVECNEI
ncbi:conserved hypothetical protein [Pediculus humanus corporis]|uniref:Secreted protein n=1 Tax=Pediculus humanus subsp. corporis TaxID=121224 RepID=E0W3G9_PEDHC|nr:uncharacterized protein Phum_PHUM604560 [Pediculus humanus corporis]EEB20175.1 conserved hypothetical protein [Pediculus humanus corporis]